MLRRLCPPSPRFVLTIGNEGGLLAELSGDRIRQQWPVTQPGDPTLAAALAEAPRRPVVVVVDLLEQSYRKESVPKLNRIDRPKVLKRRLDRAFPDAPLKAGLELGEDPEQHQNRRYLLASVPPSPDWDRWAEFLRSIENPVVALTLLPVEVTDLVGRLAKVLTSAGSEPSRWAILISPQPTGGVRQIVVDGAELALTRLTPSLSVDAPPVQRAAEVQQELKATLGYMTRLGYRTGSGLDIIVLDDQARREDFDGAALAGVQLHVLSATAAASALGFGSGMPEDAPGALLCGAWIGRQRTHTLQLLPPELRTRMMQGAALRWATAGLTASALGLVSYSALSAVTGFQIEQEVDWLRAWRDTVRVTLEQAGGDIDQTVQRADDMRAVLEAHRQLQVDRRDPFESLHALRAALVRNEQLLSFSWQLTESADDRRSRWQQQQRQTPEFTLDLTLDLGQVDDPANAVTASQKLLARLTEAFPDRPVTIERQAVDILPNQTFVGAASVSQHAAEADGGMSAELQIGAARP